jgi:hypothetical protein
MCPARYGQPLVRIGQVGQPGRAVNLDGLDGPPATLHDLVGHVPNLVVFTGVSMMG